MATARKLDRVPPGVDDAPPPLPLLGLDVLVENEYPDIRWVVPDVLPEGLTLLFSRPKIGKSMVALSIALRLALRRQRLGRGREVLYLSLDDISERRMQARVRDLLGGTELHGGIWFNFGGARRLDNGLLQQLAGALDEHPAIGMIVMDIYASVKPGRKDDDVYKHDHQVLAQLRDFADARHLAILLLHHTNKKSDTEDWIDSINGSTGLAGGCDTIWKLERARGSADVTLRIAGRDVEDATLALNLDDLDEPWSRPRMVGKEENVESDVSLCHSVTLSLSSADGPLTPKEVAAATGMTHANARQLLRRLLRRRQVVQTTYGKYTVRQSDKSDRVTGVTPDIGDIASAGESDTPIAPQRVTLAGVTLPGVTLPGVTLPPKVIPLGGAGSSHAMSLVRLRGEVMKAGYQARREAAQYPWNTLPYLDAINRAERHEARAAELKGQILALEGVHNPVETVGGAPPSDGVDPL